MKFEFETTFGSGVDPWYAKAERWAKKQPVPINFLAQGLIEWLKKIWIDAKIQNTMREVDLQATNIVQEWEKNDRTKHRQVVETGVFGDEGWSIQITNPAFGERTKISVPKLDTASDVQRLEEEERDKGS